VNVHPLGVRVLPKGPDSPLVSVSCKKTELRSRGSENVPDAGRRSHGLAEEHHDQVPDAGRHRDLVRLAAGRIAKRTGSFGHI
jgi:hypothetical protein